MDTFGTLFFGGLTCWFGYIILERYSFKKRIEKLSNIPLVFPIQIFTTEEPKMMKELQEKHGDIFITSFGFLDVVNICDPEMVKVILKDTEKVVKCIPKSTQIVDNFLGNNILNSNSHDWAKHKSLFGPSFVFDSISSFQPTFVDTCSTFLQLVQKQESGVVDVCPLFTKMTLDALGRSLLGFNFDSMSDKNLEYVQTYHDFIELVNLPLWYIFPSLGKLPLPVCHRLKNSIDKMNELFEIMIQDVMDRKNSGIKSMNPSMLEIAVDSVFCEDPLISKEELLSNLVVFFIAGHETTTCSLSWTLHLLSTHPEIQERLYNEIYSILKGRLPELDDLKEMPIVSRTIKEALRMEPPVTKMPTRKVEQDYKIPGTEYIIPKGFHISPNIVSIHNDERYWKDPQIFDPDRFIPENSKGRHPYAYMPFSLGQRMCIGSQFSLIQQQIVLSMIIQKFKIEKTLESIEKKPGNINTPKSIPLRFVPRHAKCTY